MDLHDDDRISAFVDGELDELAAARFARDVARDPALAAEVDRIRRVRDLLRRHGPVAAPEGFGDRVLDALDEDPPRRVWRIFGLRPEALALVAAAILVLWVAVPRSATEVPELATLPDIPEDAPAATLEGAGRTGVILGYPQYRVSGAPRTGVLAAVERVGGTVADTPDGLRVQLPARALNELREELQLLGKVTPVGERRIVSGRAEVVLLLDK